MRAWTLHELGAPADVLRLEDGVEVPAPGPGQVRLEGALTGLTDLANRRTVGEVVVNLSA